MSGKIHVLLVFLAMALPASADTLVDSFGHFPIPGSTWVIDVSRDGMKYQVSEREGARVAVSPPGWEAHPGWFVFVSGDNLWAYDGAKLVLCEAVTPRGSAGYRFELNRFGEKNNAWGVIPEPPSEIFNRLPPKIQKVIRQKFPSKDIQS